MLQFAWGEPKGIDRVHQFLGYRRVGDRAIVCADGDAEPLFDELANRVMVNRFQIGVGLQVTRDADFDGAITLEPVEGDYVLSYETDGSLDPVTAFNLAMNELSSRFAGLSEEISAALN